MKVSFPNIENREILKQQQLHTHNVKLKSILENHGGDIEIRLIEYDPPSAIFIWKLIPENGFGKSYTFMMSEFPLLVSTFQATIGESFFRTFESKYLNLIRDAKARLLGGSND